MNRLTKKQLFELELFPIDRSLRNEKHLELLDCLNDIKGFKLGDIVNFFEFLYPQPFYAFPLNQEGNYYIICDTRVYQLEPCIVMYDYNLKKFI